MFVFNAQTRACKAYWEGPLFTAGRTGEEGGVAKYYTQHTHTHTHTQTAFPASPASPATITDQLYPGVKSPRRVGEGTQGNIRGGGGGGERGRESERRARPTASRCLSSTHVVVCAGPAAVVPHTTNHRDGPAARESRKVGVGPLEPGLPPSRRSRP